MGSGGWFGGRQQARNRACSLIFIKRKKNHVAGIISDVTALKDDTACKRKARFRVSAVVYGLKYTKYPNRTDSGDCF